MKEKPHQPLKVSASCSETTHHRWFRVISGKKYTHIRTHNTSHTHFFFTLLLPPDRQARPSRGCSWLRRQGWGWGGTSGANAPLAGTRAPPLFHRLNQFPPRFAGTLCNFVQFGGVLWTWKVKNFTLEPWREPKIFPLFPLCIPLLLFVCSTPSPCILFPPLSPLSPHQRCCCCACWSPVGISSALHPSPKYHSHPQAFFVFFCRESTREPETHTNTDNHLQLRLSIHCIYFFFLQATAPGSKLVG